MYVQHILFIHSSANEYLGWFYFLIMVKVATINMDVQARPWHADLDSFGYIPRSSIAGPYGSSIFCCGWNLPAGIHHGCTSSYFHQHWVFPYHFDGHFVSYYYCHLVFTDTYHNISDTFYFNFVCIFSRLFFLRFIDYFLFDHLFQEFFFV